MGILGGTGSGKSSLVQLIARLYDATEGAVLVGGRDVRDYDLATLRDAVGIVLQKNVLFTGTVRENLQWGHPQASDDELLAACRAACVDEFLDRIGGLDGELGQGGAGVSGGQKQRLCIARTLLKHPRVLIFDDSTSAVDMATDAKIREHIAQIPNTTVIVIAQRIASVMDAIALWCWTTAVSTAWARTRSCWRATTSTRRFTPHRWSLRGTRMPVTAATMAA